MLMYFSKLLAFFKLEIFSELIIISTMDQGIWDIAIKINKENIKVNTFRLQFDIKNYCRIRYQNTLYIRKNDASPKASRGRLCAKNKFHTKLNNGVLFFLNFINTF